jgi:hypothetical protein
MRRVFLTLGVLGLTIGVNGQSGVTPAEARWKASEMTITPHMRDLPNGHKQGYSSLAAKTVEIRIGDTVVTADAAEVADWKGAPGRTTIVLSGNVRLTTVLNPIPPR